MSSRPSPFFFVVSSCRSRKVLFGRLFPARAAHQSLEIMAKRICYGTGFLLAHEKKPDIIMRYLFGGFFFLLLGHGFTVNCLCPERIDSFIAPYFIHLRIQTKHFFWYILSAYAPLLALFDNYLRPGGNLNFLLK